MKGWMIGLIVVVVAVLAIVGIKVLGSDNTSNTTNPASTNSATNTPGSNSTTQNNSSPGNTSDSAVKTDKVAIQNMAFGPAVISVKKGTKVTWTNQDSTSHTVTSDSGTTMNSQSLSNGDTYSVTFDTVGTFTYHCKFHSNMTGTVTVTE